MKKLVMFFLCITLSIVGFGCNNTVQEIKNVVSENPDEVDNKNLQSEENSDNSDEEHPLFKTIAINKDTTFKVSDYCWNLYQAKESDNKIVEDRVYKVNGVSGKSDVHYPFFKDGQGKYDVLNSIVLAKIVDAYQYSSLEEKVDRKINYCIKFMNTNYVSIIFTGQMHIYEASRQCGISFAVNFDLMHNTPVSISDVIDTRNTSDKLKDVLLEKIHNAMRVQLDKDIVDLFEKIAVEEIERQLYQADSSYYIANDKIYLRFTLYNSTEYSTFLYFDIKNK